MWLIKYLLFKRVDKYLIVRRQRWNSLAADAAEMDECDSRKLSSEVVGPDKVQ